MKTCLLQWDCVATSWVVLCWLGSAWKLLVKLGFLQPQPSKTEAQAMLIGLGQLRLSLWEFYHVMVGHLFFASISIFIVHSFLATTSSHCKMTHTITTYNQKPQPLPPLTVTPTSTITSTSIDTDTLADGWKVESAGAKMRSRGFLFNLSLQRVVQRSYRGKQ